jgi:signal transduction histidine kinase
LQFARVRPINITNINISRILEDVRVLLAHDCNLGSVELDFSYEESELMLRADGEQIKDVFLNFGINALQAMAGSGKLEVRAFHAMAPQHYRKHDVTKGGGVEVIFADTGPGLAPGAAEKIFEPFYTTKPKGTGLGLSIVHRVVMGHNGIVWANEKPGKGAEFHCWIPIHGPYIPERRNRRTTNIIVRKAIDA